MDDCLFCKIANSEIETEKVYENDYVTAFRDINPQASVHVLIIPKTHAASILDIGAHNAEYLTAMFAAANDLALQMGLEKNGFRLVINTGDDGGQTVRHLHLHLLGGRRFGWPPG